MSVLSLLPALWLAHLLIDFLGPWRRWREADARPFWRQPRLWLLPLLQGLACGGLLALAGNGALTACLGAVLVAALRKLTLLPARPALDSLARLLLEQGLQLALLGLLGLLLSTPPVDLGEGLRRLLTPATLLIALGVFANLAPASRLIAALLRPWLPALPDDGSLRRAGSYIGYLERLLIFTFVLLGEWSAVGFLLTAKSVLRLRELESRAMSEYVLLGTLLSFAVAIGLGLLVRLAQG